MAIYAADWQYRTEYLQSAEVRHRCTSVLTSQSKKMSSSSMRRMMKRPFPPCVRNPVDFDRGQITIRPKNGNLLQGCTKENPASEHNPLHAAAFFHLVMRHERNRFSDYIQMGGTFFNTDDRTGVWAFDAQVPGRTNEQVHHHPGSSDNKHSRRLKTAAPIPRPAPLSLS